MGTSGSRTQRDKRLSGGDSESRSNRSNISDSQYWAKHALLRTDYKATGRQLVARDILMKERANIKTHITEEYEINELVLRRGWKFTFTVLFDRAITKKDKVIIQFATGARPNEGNGSIIRLHVADKPADSSNPKSWFIDYESFDGACATFTIAIPSDAIVGKYSIFLETRQDGNVFRSKHKKDFFVIFNPWCQDDSVYLISEEERLEYVMNETGKIWRGSIPTLIPSSWNFGQFEDCCLLCAMFLLDLAELSPKARADPVLVVRTLSAMTNSDDSDGGILTGRWASTYPSPGTKPWVWNGSVAILEEFMKHKKPVKYGQCWVFAGLTCSLLRSLGIPTRVVTTFNSGIDRDESMTVDRHWSNSDSDVNWRDESEWNFHVWTESWFKRPDLPGDFDGWQAQDATPQERSEGVFRCGPASVKAIKEGLVYLNYDTMFMMSEVNGDRAHWIVRNDGSLKLMKLDRDYVGKYISTKAIGTNEREDITHHYKYPEGSSENQKAMETAMKHSSRVRLIPKFEEREDVQLSIDLPEGVGIGADFEVGVWMKNVARESKKCRLLLTVSACYYTNVADCQIDQEEYLFTLKGDEEYRIKLNVEAVNYLQRIRDEAVIRVEAKATTNDDDSLVYASEGKFQLVIPQLHILAPTNTVVGTEFSVTLQLTNPLSVKLKNTQFHVEGAGIAKPTHVSHSRSVKPGEEIVKTMTLKASRPGKRQLIASFSSDELIGITGTVEINVMAT